MSDHYHDACTHSVGLRYRFWRLACRLHNWRCHTWARLRGMPALGCWDLWFAGRRRDGLLTWLDRQVLGGEWRRTIWTPCGLAMLPRHTLLDMVQMWLWRLKRALIAWVAVAWMRLHGCKPEQSGYLWWEERKRAGRMSRLDEFVRDLGTTYKMGPLGR